MEIKALLKGLYTFGGSTFEKDVPVTRTGDLLVAQSLPPYTELARRGMGWSVISLVAVAGLVVRPGTVALVTIFNDEPPTGKSYIIDRLYTHQLVSASAESYFGIWACLHKETAEPVGADDLSAEIRSHNGRTKYAGNAVVGINETVVDDGWFPYGMAARVEAAGTLPGSQAEAIIAGRLVVPPKRSLSIHVVAGTTSEDFTVGASWFEAQLDNE